MENRGQPPTLSAYPLVPLVLIQSCEPEGRHRLRVLGCYVIDRLSNSLKNSSSILTSIYTIFGKGSLSTFCLMPLGFSVLINNNLLKSLFITMSLEDRPGYDPADHQYQVSCLESSNFVFHSSISRSISSIHIHSIKVKSNRCDKPNEITNQKYFHQQSSTSAYLR